MIMGRIQWSGACGCCWNCCGRTVATTLSTQKNLVDVWFRGLSHVARCPAARQKRERERETKQVVHIPRRPSAFPAACAQDSILPECICAWSLLSSSWLKNGSHLFICSFQIETKQVVHIPHQQPLRISSSLSTGFNSKGRPSCMEHVQHIVRHQPCFVLASFWFDWWW